MCVCHGVVVVNESYEKKGYNVIMANDIFLMFSFLALTTTKSKFMKIFISKGTPSMRTDQDHVIINGFTACRSAVSVWVRYQDE